MDLVHGLAILSPAWAASTSRKINNQPLEQVERKPWPVTMQRSQIQRCRASQPPQSAVRGLPLQFAVALNLSSPR
jgi:hypothetical protein